MVMREVMVLVGGGLALGLSAAALTTRFVASLLYALKPNDPLTFTVAAAVLVAVGCIAGYLPARRASRLDPIATRASMSRFGLKRTRWPGFCFRKPARGTYP
jgi:ABC-type antimicrobial peptide transport system permease subunit